MIFELNQKQNTIKHLKRYSLRDIGWGEGELQKLLYENIEKVLQDEELLVIMHSRKWQEEPDLMAIDASGDLYIFELKAWESQHKNLLQALRYGQIFGQYGYDSLNELYLKFSPQAKDLIEALENKFGTAFAKDKINQKQHFVIITNGLDFKTREAIVYWRELGIDIRSWIYRIYKRKEEIVLIEFNTFRIKDDPFEDLEEGAYILNTNYRNNPKLDKEMLNNEKAAAYFDPWKKNIEKLSKNDKIFLYRSGEGIVAIGLASGKLEKKNYLNNPQYPDEEYYMKLNNFKILKKPLPAAKIKEITEVNYRFMQTMFSVNNESSEKLWKVITENY